jgi:hypothetical protein
MNRGSEDFATSTSLPGLQQLTPETVTSPFEIVNANETAHKIDTKRLEDVGTRDNLMVS